MEQHERPQGIQEPHPRGGRRAGPPPPAQGVPGQGGLRSPRGRERPAGLGTLPERRCGPGRDRCHAARAGRVRGGPKDPDAVLCPDHPPDGSGRGDESCGRARARRGRGGSDLPALHGGGPAGRTHAQGIRPAVGPARAFRARPDARTTPGSGLGHDLRLGQDRGRSCGGASSQARGRRSDQLVARDRISAGALMKARLASFRLWLLVAVLTAGVVGFAGARMAIGRIERSNEHAADRAKDLQIARAIGAQVAAGADVRRLRIIQSVLPNDQILVYRAGRRLFAGPAIRGSDFELEVVTPFPGGRVLVRDYHPPVSGASLELTLVVGGWVLLVVVAALGAAWLLTRALQAPIERAAVAADRVAAGDLGARIGPAGPDEFARLSNAFDSMAGRLEAADRDQRQFLADVAHEIATPVNAISGLAGALADGTLGTREQRAEAAGLIEAETGRLGSMLEDLRRLTRLDLAEPVRRERVDLADLCSSAHARFVPAARRAEVELAVQANNLHVTADRRLLETVLDNFVSNAIRYTPAGGRVSIRTSRLGDALVVSVADTGIGIAREDLERIFDRFYRVDRARDRATGGFGLGFALARRAAQALDGRIEVSSEPGRGSEFRLVLAAPS